MFPKKKLECSEDEIFDIAIIGAGVVGCGIFKEFCENGAKTVLVEKANDILEGASKGNSAILHTGFDAPPESLELECVKRGYSEYLKIKKKLNLPLLNTKALVVAWSDEQVEKLDGILKKGLNNGVKELELLTDKQIFEKEPNLSKNAKAALLVHGESLIDPWNSPLAYVKLGLQAGGKLAFSHEVTDGHFNGEFWEIKTSQKIIKAKTVINAAGLYGDIVDSIKGSKDFKIIPRKGQFIIFDKTAYNLINSIILPVPTKITKGVVITKTAFGNILVGPTAEDQESRDDSVTKEETIKMLLKKAYELLPDLQKHNITATFAGLRPASDKNHYRVKINDEKNWITVGGIRSTGLTSSLGLAKYVYELNDRKYEKKKKKASVIKIQNISEFQTRDYQDSDYGKIVCHCECVTQREIENALKGEASAGTIGGLKRRTRITMGRCQGFNCQAEVSEICEKSQS
ncbi:MAG TPA: FAD/NAD(P)-binding oxidoreductase [Sulfurospirillum arcachonense]|nr:FAD/NAD(P)-binding oxidoreductase [Sulfurospirillum arcachonense]HIP44162.1 FAD/NAD(P)-binding oxidoreductase [Sulfurospirillum arcachonense]